MYELENHHIFGIFIITHKILTLYDFIHTILFINCYKINKMGK